MNSISTHELANWLDSTLQPQRFRDYCPNGLQVEGKTTVNHIITGVTASQALLEEAVRKKADAVLVHHGWFWKNEDPCVRGTKRKRLQLALQHELNLFAFHLPLDAHPVLGNNAQLAQTLRFEPDRDADGNPVTCGPDGLVWLGRLAAPQPLNALGQAIGDALHRAPLVVGKPQQRVQRVAWCTGGAQGFMQAAIDAGVDAYLTGEASEQTFHLAQETGVAFIGAGHHATERYGIKALGEAAARELGVSVEFVDLDNPV